MALHTKNRIKIGAAIAACLVCAAMTPSIALAADGDNAAPQPASEKNETVRIFADATGKPLNVEVQTVLRNGNGDSFLLDETDLTDIVPKDDCGYTVDNADLIWQADGLDVTYTGETSKEAPVGVSVTYTLDGKNVSPSELAGASGHVTIHYDYANNAIIDGAATPFMMITGLLLDDSKFSNVTVKNGKIISDESRTIVIGYAMPGMQASLELEKEDMELPAYFEIEADVTNFELNASLTMASTDLFDDFSNDDIDISELSESADELSSAMAEIIDAASEFRDGLKELDKGAKSLSDALTSLKNKIPMLASAVALLSEGSEELKAGLDGVVAHLELLDSGAEGIASGINTMLYGDGGDIPGMSYIADGASGLASGLEDVKSGIAALNDPDAGLPYIQAGIDEIKAKLSGEQMQQLVAAMQGAIQEMSAYASLQEITSESYSAAVSTKNALDSIPLEGMTEEQLQAVQAAKDDAAIAVAAASAAQQAAQSTSTTYTSIAVQALQGFSAQIADLQDSLQKVSSGLGAVIDSIEEKLLPGVSELAQGASDISDGLDQVVIGLNNLKVGADALASGIEKLSDEKEGLPAAASGAGDLSSGLNELYGQTGEMQNGADQLAEGASELQKGTGEAASGSEELLDGLETYNDKGIQEVVNKIKVDLQGFVDRFLASSDLGRAYDNFAGKAEGTPSSVKFVFELEGISAEA